MRPELQKLCEKFIASRDEVKKAFKAEFDDVYPICANIFLSHGKTAEAERIKECRGYIKENTGVLNNFRGPMYAPTACLLACSANPEEKMAQAAANYKLLKKHFFSSDQLVLASMILTGMATPETVTAKAERGRAIYDLMKKQHRILTGEEDSVLAVLLAFSDRSDEELIASMEECFSLLKGMAGRDRLQSVSEIFALSDKPNAEKCARFKDLFDSLRESGLKYGKDYELPVLASLAVTDESVPDLVADISDVSAFLKTQKGYRGIFGRSKKTRFMHAAMLVSTYLTPSAEGDVAALASMISMIALQMIVMTVIVMNSASAAAAASR